MIEASLAASCRSPWLSSCIRVALLGDLFVAPHGAVADGNQISSTCKNGILNLLLLLCSSSWLSTCFRVASLRDLFVVPLGAGLVVSKVVEQPFFRNLL